MQGIVANLAPAKGRLVPAFRSSCAIVEPPFTNFGKQRALAIQDSSAAFDLKFLFGTRGNLCRNFKSAALVPHDFAVRDRPRSSHAPARPSHPASRVVTIAIRPPVERGTAPSATDLGSRSLRQIGTTGKFRITDMRNLRFAWSGKSVAR